MFDVRMDPAVRNEPQQVHPVAAVERCAEHRVLVERPVLDRLVHTHQVLIEPTPRADRQVADLAVPHLSRRQAGRLARRLDRRVRVVAPQRIEDRGVGKLDRVPRAGGRNAPAVEDDQNYEGEALRHIAANEPTSREAPPTSAPSTAGCDISSAALSGFTEPP